MRRPLGLILLLIGLAWCGWHAFQAVQTLGSLYTDTVNRPLEGPAGGEQAVSKSMISHVIRAAIGLPVLIIGSVMLRRARRRTIKL